MRDLFFSKFTVHSAYSSSCRPMYDGVSPHWKERERKIVCVWCWQCGAAWRGAAHLAFCGTGLPCAPPYKALRHSGIQVLHSPAARRATSAVPFAAPPHARRRSRPDHTKHVAAMTGCREKTHPVGRFPTSSTVRSKCTML